DGRRRRRRRRGRRGRNGETRERFAPSDEQQDEPALAQDEAEGGDEEAGEPVEMEGADGTESSQADDSEPRRRRRGRPGGRRRRRENEGGQAEGQAASVLDEVEGSVAS